MARMSREKFFGNIPMVGQKTNFVASYTSSLQEVRLLCIAGTFANQCGFISAVAEKSVKRGSVNG